MVQRADLAAVHDVGALQHLGDGVGAAARELWPLVAGDEGQHLASSALVVQGPAPRGMVICDSTRVRTASLLEEMLRRFRGAHAREAQEVGPCRVRGNALLQCARRLGRGVVRGDHHVPDDAAKPLVHVLPGRAVGGGVVRQRSQRAVQVLVMGDRGAAGQKQRADHRRRHELGVMSVLPVKLVPNRRDLAVVLEVGEAVVPVAGQGDLLGEEPPAVFQPALADHGLKAGHAQVGAQGEVVLPRADEDDVPVLVHGHKLPGQPSLAAACSTARRTNTAASSRL